MGDVTGSYFKVHQRFFSRPKSFQKSIIMMHDRPKGLRVVSATSLVSQ